MNSFLKLFIQKNIDTKTVVNYLMYKRTTKKKIVDGLNQPIHHDEELQDKNRAKKINRESKEI